MILRQTTHNDELGQGKIDYDWEILGVPRKDKRGKFVRIGCWKANHWFCIAVGKTDKLTLSYAKRRLQIITMKPSIFRYIT